VRIEVVTDQFPDGVEYPATLTRNWMERLNDCSTPIAVHRKYHQGRAMDEYVEEVVDRESSVLYKGVEAWRPHIVPLRSYQ
jgi:hypothetical protein